MDTQIVVSAHKDQVVLVSHLGANINVPFTDVERVISEMRRVKSETLVNEFLTSRKS